MTEGVKMLMLYFGVIVVLVLCAAGSIRWFWFWASLVIALIGAFLTL